MSRRRHDRQGPASRAPARAAAPLPRALDALLLGALFAALAAASWERWADPFIDFGRELYVAWRLAEGATLYRDVAYFNGPLSPHWNATLFRQFGVSTGTLYAANLAVVATVTGLLYLGLGRLAGRLAALLGAGVYLALFAFAQLLTVAGFNFVAPYSHEATHGTLLALLALAGLFVWLERGRALAAFAAGAALGAVLLTKPEFPVAVGGAFAAALVATCRFRRVGWAPARRGAGWMLAGAVLAPAGTWLALRWTVGATVAAEALGGMWRHVANPDVRALEFYRQGLGVDAPFRNLLSAAVWLAGAAAALAAGRWLARRLGERGGGAATAAFVVAPGVLLAAAAPRLDWTGFARPLPWLTLFAAVSLLVGLAGLRKAGGAAEPRDLQALAAVVFAGLLLLKMALNARLYQYGFALAMPASVLAVAALVGELPRRLVAAGAARRRFVGWTVSLLAAVVAFHLGVSAGVWRQQSVRFEAGRDRLRGDAQARFLALAVERVEATAAPGATLAVLPEGVMVNYLTRHVNPTPFVNFMPPELRMFGEGRIAAAFRAAPPDYVLLTNRDAADYGLGMFGADHGRELMSWVQASYELVETIREPTSAGRYFSYGLLLRRRPEIAPSAPDAARADS